MRSFIIKPGDLIPIGRAGENQATEIRFDVTGWAETFGAGTFELIMQRPGDSELPYPVEVTANGDYVDWTVSNVDTGIAGNCKVQLRYVVSDAVAKSVIYRGIVGESLDHAVDPPDPYDDLVERIEELARQTEQNAEAASRSAGNASDSADAAGRSAGNASDSADAAGRSAGNAAQSVTDANAAKLAAQAAQQHAEAAQAGAEAAEARIMDTVPDAVTNWLNNHVDPATGYVIDDSMTIQNAAADAKAVGDALIDKAPIITDTASGAIASFPDGSAAPIKQLTVAVNPVQDLHGYSNPWPAGGGANIWDEVTELGAILTTTGGNTARTDQIRAKNFIPVSAGQDYRVVTRTGTNNGIWMLFYDSNKTVISEGLPSGSISGSSNNARRYDNGATVTMPENCAFIRFYFQTGYGTIYNNDTAINYPSTVTTYSPYSNVCPITGWTGAEVTVSPTLDAQDGQTYPITFPNKNKFGGTLLQGYWAFANGVFASSNTWVSTDKIPCKPSTYYTVSANDKQTRYQGFVWYDSNGSFISESSLQQNVNIGYTAQSPSNAAYLVFNIAGYPNTSSEISPSDVTQLQIEEGQSATAYEPPIGVVYGGTLTVNQDGTGTLSVDGILEVFDMANGDYVWSLLNSFSKSTGSVGTVGDYTRITFAVRSGDQSAYNRVSSSYPVGYRLCNMAKHSFAYNEESTHWYRNTVLYLFLPTSVCGDTRESVYNYLVSIKDTTPLTMWLQFATPQTYTLTAEQVTTLLGQNNVWANTGDTSVTYRADTKLYIDKKLAALVAALS